MLGGKSRQIVRSNIGFPKNTIQKNMLPSYASVFARTNHCIESLWWILIFMWCPPEGALSPFLLHCTVEKIVESRSSSVGLDFNVFALVTVVSLYLYIFFNRMWTWWIRTAWLLWCGQLTGRTGLCAHSRIPQVQLFILLLLSTGLPRRDYKSHWNSYNS